MSHDGKGTSRGREPHGQAEQQKKCDRTSAITDRV